MGMPCYSVLVNTSWDETLQTLDWTMSSIRQPPFKNRDSTAHFGIDMELRKMVRALCVLADIGPGRQDVKSARLTL